MRNGGVWQVASGATVGRADSRAAEGEGGGIRGGGRRGGGGGGSSGGGEKGWGVGERRRVGVRRGERGGGDLLAAGVGIRSACTTRRECVRYYGTEETEKDVATYARKREIPYKRRG